MPQFDESKHPRAEDGKFTSKGSGSTATSKKEKEYNPKGSSLKAGDSISYKEDTAYGGERRKGKIASIDEDTITTTDGRKVNKFNAFLDKKEVENNDEDETYGVDADFIRSYGPVPDKEEFPKQHQEYMDSYNTWLKNGETFDGVDAKSDKQQKLDIINKFNPMTDDYHTGIRTVDDIKDPQEAFDPNDSENFAYPDFTKEDAEMAMKTGKIKVYSSKPIEQGGFISPSRMMAQDYAGSGKVYESEVDINDVAWINSDEGQFAKVEKTKTNIDPERAEAIESGKEDWIITKEDEEVWNSLSDDDKYFLSMSSDMGFWFDTIMDNEDGLEHYNELKSKFSVGKEKPKSKLPF